MARNVGFVVRSEALTVLKAHAGLTALLDAEQIFDRQPSRLSAPRLAILRAEITRERLSAGTVQRDVRLEIEVLGTPHARGADPNLADDVAEEAIEALETAAWDLSASGYGIPALDGYYAEDPEWAAIEGDQGEELHANRFVFFVRTLATE